MTVARIELPPKAIPAYSQHYRYIGLYGGRGSAKSYTAHKMAAIAGYAEPKRILCAREFQNSLKESSFAQVEVCINSEPWLASHYSVGESYIRGANGTEFLFAGLSRNPQSIKSMVDIDIVIVEEAEQVSQQSIDLLIPTIRKAGSTLVFVWNRGMRGSPIDNLLINHPPDDACVIEMNWRDNPWFSDELEAERQHHKKHYPVTYNHVWEGGYMESSETNPFLSYTIGPKTYTGKDVYDPELMHRVISIDVSQCTGADYFVMCEQGRDYQGDTHLIDMYRTNDAPLTDRLEKVAQWIRRRRPNFLVVERNTDSITFIDVLTLYLQSEDLRIKINDPTAASRGKKEDYIVNWLQPMFNDNVYFCNKSTLCDTIHSKMYAFSVDRTDNEDDELDTMASGVRYLVTPERPKLEPTVNNMKLTSDVQKKLQRALSGKRAPMRKDFT